MFRLQIISLIIAASVVASDSSPASAKSSRTHAFDGNWSIEVITERGGCDRAYRYGIRIENGQASYNGSTDFIVTGQVTSGGAVRGSISHGEDRADVVGKLSGGFGNGSWTTNGSTRCGGIWNAEQRS